MPQLARQQLTTELPLRYISDGEEDDEEDDEEDEEEDGEGAEEEEEEEEGECNKMFTKRLVC